MSLQNIKVKVPTPEVSRLVQEKLFELGYEWMSGPYVKNEYQGYLFGYDDGRLTHSSHAETFASNCGVEMEVVAEERLVLVDFKPTRGKVIVFGKTYFADEVEVALERLTAI